MKKEVFKVPSLDEKEQQKLRDEEAHILLAKEKGSDVYRLEVSASNLGAALECLDVIIRKIAALYGAPVKSILSVLAAEMLKPEDFATDTPTASTKGVTQ